MFQPYDRIQNQKTLLELSAGYRRSGVTVHLPTETECSEIGCGHDTFTDSKKKVDCVVCNPRGYVVTWNTQTIYCRIRWTDPLRFTVQIAAGIELADLNLYIRKSDYEAVKSVLDSPSAYMTVDGQRVRPTAIQPEGVGGVDEFQCRCNKAS